jgi:hypothetical protein
VRTNPAYEAIFVDRYPVDQFLTDAAHLGPEAAHLADVYLRTPRALVWRNASSDWPLLVILLPMATRLSMIGNPIFANLVRDWGLNLRVIGVDAEQRVFDFRKLMSDDILRKLVGALHDDARITSEQQANPALDLLFSALAGGMLTMLEQRRADWPAHLARSARLEPSVLGSLFDRLTRFSDFLRALRLALKTQTIDIDFYGRALRSIDLREEAVERRIASLVQASMAPQVIQQLQTTAVGLHLGCYNWLAIDPQHAHQRQYVLQRLSCFAQFFADHLLSHTDLRAGADGDYSVWPQAVNGTISQSIAQAVDSGQDRKVIDALAQRFAISSNTLRQLWRAAPAQLGTPATWHLQQILFRLDAVEPRSWPKTSNDWLEFKQAAAR